MGTKYSKGAADLYIGDDISGSLPVNPDYQEQFDPKSELSIAKRQYESNIVDKMTQTEANRALAIQERKRKSTNGFIAASTLFIPSNTGVNASIISSEYLIINVKPVINNATAVEAA